jgi:stage V sporulation protein B
MYLDGAVDAMLKGLGKQIYTMRVNIIDSLLSVLLIVALLPSFGIKGYVMVIFVTELINTSFSILKLLNVSNVSTPVNKWVVKPIASIFLATAFSRLIFNFDMFFLISGKGLTFIEITFTTVLYLIISRFIGSITKNDTDFFKRVAKK